MSDDQIRKDFDRFTGEAQKFSEETDQRIGELDTAKKPAESHVQARGLRRLRDATGYEWFSLGPVYHSARLQHDIIAEFEELVGSGKLSTANVTLNFELFPDLRPMAEGITWAGHLQAMPAAAFRLFKRHMDSQIARVREDDEYFRYRCHLVRCPDPLAIQTRTLSPTDLDARLHVFVPSTNLRQYLPIPNRERGIISLKKVAPDPVVVREADVGLGRVPSEKEAQERLRKLREGA